MLERLVIDLFLPVAIVAHPTVREPDGFAMSPRNRFLSPEERRTAAAIPRVLQGCTEALRSGAGLEVALGEARAALAAEGFALDYLEARRADTLRPVLPDWHGPVRLLVAAWLGATRLIDNVAV